MSKIADYLRSHLRGEVITSHDARETYSRDGSVLKYSPLLVVHPFDINDIRKVVHFAWQLAQKKYTLPVTARGGGSNTVGSAINNGVVIDCSTHMNMILELDTKQRLVRVQPGLKIDTLQQTLRTHGLEWPVTSTGSKDTVGGVIANDTVAKDNTSVADWIDQVEVVLANGDVLQAGNISKRELGKKKGLSSSEGDIYRRLDGLLHDLDETNKTDLLKNSVYGADRLRDGKQFSLLPIINGSEGTLGIISEVILKLDTYSPEQEVLSVFLPSLDLFDKTLESIQKLQPSNIEFIPKELVMYAKDHLGVSVSELIDREDETNLEGALFIRFAGPKSKKVAKKAAKLCDKAGYLVVSSDQNYEAAREIWQIHDSLKQSLFLAEQDHKKPIPLLDDAMLEPSRIVDFGEKIAELEKKHRVKIFWWGDLLSGTVRAYPLLNLHLLTDRQKVRKLMDDYYRLIVENDGGVIGTWGVGRLRSHYVETDSVDDIESIDSQIKNIFDESNLLNPEVKLSTLSPKDFDKHLAETFNNNLYI